MRGAQQLQEWLGRRLAAGAEVQELPEPRRVLGRRIGGGRVEDVVEPFLRLGEALVLGQVHGDRDRDVVEQLPVVIGIGTADGRGRSRWAAWRRDGFTSIGARWDLVIRRRSSRRAGRRGNSGSTGRRSGRPWLVELFDQLADERVEEVLEGVDVKLVDRPEFPGMRLRDDGESPASWKRAAPGRSAGSWLAFFSAAMPGCSCVPPMLPDGADLPSLECQ